MFYKEKLVEKLNIFVPKWEEKIGIKSSNYIVRKMKNKWGSCNISKKELTFNLELAKKNDAQIQYVVIHELLHLIEPKHNDNFRNLLNSFCPNWERHNELLNELLDTNKKFEN